MSLFFFCLICFYFPSKSTTLFLPQNFQPNPLLTNNIGNINGLTPICLNSVFSRVGKIECDNRPLTCTNCNLNCFRCVAVSCNAIGSCANSDIFIDGVESGAILNCGGNIACTNSTIVGINIDNVWFTDGAGALSNLYIEGSRSGVTLACGGDYGCFEIFARLFRAKILGCNGDVSCAQSTFIAECLPLGCPLKCDGDFSCFSNTFKIKNLLSFDCNGDNSCAENKVDVSCVKRGCKFIFNGDDSFTRSELNATSVSSFNCGGDNTCNLAKINITCVKSGCPIECVGDYSCNGTTINAKSVSTLNCAGENACRNQSNFRLECDKGCLIECSGVNSCIETKIVAGPKVNFISCVSANACVRARINAICNSRGCNLECLGVNGCLKTIFDVKNAANLRCGSGACRNVLWNIKMRQKGGILSCDVNGCRDSNMYIQSLSGIKASGAYALTRTTLRATLTSDSASDFFVIDAGRFSLFDARITLTVTGKINKGIKIICSGASSCELLKLKISSSFIVKIDSIVCGGVNSCRDFELVIHGPIRFHPDIVKATINSNPGMKVYFGNLQIFSA